MKRRTTLTELRNGLATAMDGLAESRELATQAVRNLEEAEAAFQTADCRHHDRLLWAAHSAAALPGLKESRAALVDARGKLQKRREDSAMVRGAVADGERLVALSPCLDAP